MSVLARWCYRHRLVVIVIWVGVLAGLAGMWQVMKTSYDNSFILPGTGRARLSNCYSGPRRPRPVTPTPSSGR